MRRFSLLTGIVLVVVALMLAPAASAQATTLAAPANDDFAGAQPIVIGKDYTVTNIHEATVEAGQPSTNSCGSSFSMNHTVWYSFTLPNAGTVLLSTGGSIFNYTDLVTPDTKIAVYSGATLGTLSQVACNDDADTLYGQVVMTAAAGTTYYVMAGAFPLFAALPGSVLRLQTRMLSYAYDPPNAGFETPLTGADWKVTTPTGDAAVCADPTYQAYLGACAFKFAGGPGENSRLKLSKPLAPEFAPRKGGTLMMSLRYRIQDATLGTAKIKFKVHYSDGTPTSTGTLNLTGAPTTLGYILHTQLIILKSKAVSKVQFQADFKSTTGVLMLDDADIIYFATSATRGDGALPLPASK